MGSGRRVARQPWHAVEIGVVTGEVSQTMSLHDRHNQGVATEKLVLLAKRRGRHDQRLRDRHHLDAKGGDVIYRLPMTRKVANLRVMFLEAGHRTSLRPAATCYGFNGHQPVGHVGQHMGGGAASEFLAGDAFHQQATSGPNRWFGCEMIDEDIGVNEQVNTLRDVILGHGDSKTSNSGSRAILRTVSASPVQPISP
jgi:hypothetical protein